MKIRVRRDAGDLDIGFEADPDSHQEQRDLRDAMLAAVEEVGTGPGVVLQVINELEKLGYGIDVPPELSDGSRLSSTPETHDTSVEPDAGERLSEKGGAA